MYSNFIQLQQAKLQRETSQMSKYIRDWYVNCNE